MSGESADIPEQAEEASESVSRSGKWYARVTLGLLYLVTVAVGVGAWWFGVIDPSIIAEATIDLSGPLQVLAWAFIGGTAVFFVGLVLMALPGSIIRVIFEVLDSISLPERYK